MTLVRVAHYHFPRCWAQRNDEGEHVFANGHHYGKADRRASLRILIQMMRREKEATTKEKALMEEPQTDAEWQDAADAAHAALSLDAARAYGLVAGGIEVDAARCEEILAEAETRGISPSVDAPTRFAYELVSGGGERIAVARARRPL